MAQYRKKPVVVEAIRVTKEMRNNFGPFPEWALPHLVAGRTEKIENSGWIQVKTLEGYMNVSDGDYLICGVKGEVYPCKPDIFEQTYEPVEETVSEYMAGMAINAVFARRNREVVE